MDLLTAKGTYSSNLEDRVELGRMMAKARPRDRATAAGSTSRGGG